MRFFNRIFPMSLRPQAHDIIRTWAFYTIVKSLYHFDKLPWSHIAISGHGLTPERRKVSKSKGDPSDPIYMLEEYSADAIRYWSTTAKLGDDTIISEDKMVAGQKLVNKMWNVTNFSFPFLEVYTPPKSAPPLLPTDKWVLSKLQHLVTEVTKDYQEYDHASVKNKIEKYFWDTITDNYLEMVKTRLYDSPDGSSERESAKFTLYNVLLTIVKVLAPIIPYVTEEIFQAVFQKHADVYSVHLSNWPGVQDELINDSAEVIGDSLIEIATAVRRYKSERKMPMGSRLDRVRIAVSKDGPIDDLHACIIDIGSVTRAEIIEIYTDSSVRTKPDESKLAFSVTVEEIK